VAGGRDGVENVESDSVETQQIDPSLPGHRSTLHCAPCLWMTVSESFCSPGCNVGLGVSFWGAEQGQLPSIRSVSVRPHLKAHRPWPVSRMTATT
jgi:hypothetical protein